jgi:orotate phosphoribosyltransferase-like protein
LKKNILNDTVTLLVGIDYWGSIIAAHLSILTCLQNLPIPSRNDRNHYSKAELLEHNKDLFEKKYSNIVIIIDVINTGKTVLKIIEDLREVLKLDKKCKFHCISVISDKMQKKEMSLSKLTTFGTLCGKLRQPIIAKDFLPPEEILARKEYFKD